MPMKKASHLTKITIIIVALLIAAGAVGATLAYITAKTPPVENEFEKAVVSCKVTETFDGAKKTDVAVQNTGNVASYVRAVVVVSWVSSDNGAIFPAMPVEGVDFSLSAGSAVWQKSSDGYYYCTTPIKAGASTDILISSIEEMAAAPDGYVLSVQIAASAIQATPATVVETCCSAHPGIQGQNIHIRLKRYPSNRR